MSPAAASASSSSGGGSRSSAASRFGSKSPVCAVLGDLRRVEGVSVSGPDGRYDLMAKAVIACAGGFQANPEMRARYLEGNTDMMKVRGSRHDTGEVLRYLIDLGARPAGHWQSGHMSPIDAKAPDFETPQHADGRGNTQSRYDYPYGITVNALGLRFFDEGEAQHSYTYAKTGRAVLAQPGAIAYQLYDQTGLSCLRYPHHKATFVEAGTIAELAGKVGIEPAVLVHTVEEFNRAVCDDRPFLPGRLDGRATRGLAVPKSNWATRIEAPPFRAYPVTGGVTFTFGGVEIDHNAQVISTMDRPVRGLFASGDIVGLFFHNYPSFTGPDAKRRVRAAGGTARGGGTNAERRGIKRTMRRDRAVAPHEDRLPACQRLPCHTGRQPSMPVTAGSTACRLGLWSRRPAGLRSAAGCIRPASSPAQTLGHGLHLRRSCRRR